MMTCENCGNRMRRRKASPEKPYHYQECELKSVLLVGIYVFECPNCGTELPEIPSMVDLHDEIASALLTKPSVLDGTEIRYLRKNIGLRASDFAEFLDTTAVSVSRWETGEQPVSKENDRLIRYFYVRYKEELTKRHIKRALVEHLRHITHEEKSWTLNVSVGPRGMSTEFVEANG